MGRGSIRGGEDILFIVFGQYRLVSEREREMRSMIERLKSYMDKKLEMNAGKTKLIRFRRGEEKWRKVRWRWKKKGI